MPQKEILAYLGVLAFIVTGTCLMDQVRIKMQLFRVQSNRPFRDQFFRLHYKRKKPS